MADQDGPPPNEFAARMGDPIQHTHTFDWGAIAAIAGVALVVVVVLFPPSILLEAGAALVAGEVGVAGTTLAGSATAAAPGLFASAEGWGLLASGWSSAKVVGEDVGSHFNYIAGDIKDGSPTIAIGIGQPKAARMSDPLRCHEGNTIATGSISVFMDVPLWNASRKKLDYTDCGGQIEDGCHTVQVGGVPIRRPGHEIKEQGALWYRVVSLGADIVSVYTGLGGLSFSKLKWGSGSDAFMSAMRITSAGAKTYKDISDWVTPLPFAKEVDLLAGTGAKIPGMRADLLKSLNESRHLMREAKLASDVANMGGKGVGYVTNPSAPHIPSYSAGGP